MHTLTPAQRGGINGGAGAVAWMRKHGHTPAGQALWSDGEVDLLRQLWPDRYRVLSLMPHRTLTAVEHKADKLGLGRVRQLHWWTAADASRFRRLWPTASKIELMEAFPWASWAALASYSQWQRKNGYPGLMRPRIPFKPTGDPLVDGLMREAFRLNLSLSDLDALARSRRFFASGRYRMRKNWRHLGRAVEALEGIIAVRFAP
jgi:hypothetical protein